MHVVSKVVRFIKVEWHDARDMHAFYPQYEKSICVCLIGALGVESICVLIMELLLSNRNMRNFKKRLILAH